MLGDAVEVSVVAIARSHVRVGIEAPQNVSVKRAEVYAARDGGRGNDGDGAETP
jgi:carbon storage regulator CsrA